MQHGHINPGDVLATIGVEFVRLSIGTSTLWAWEAGGRERFRAISEAYYRNAKGFAFVVDSSDQNGINEACQELGLMKREKRCEKKPILILANKQDLPNAMPIDELKTVLALNEFDEGIVWHIQAASAFRNQGIREGFEWLASNLAPQPNVMTPIQETINDAAALKTGILSFLNFDNWKKYLNKFIDF